MDDVQRLQEHALARERLLGSYVHGPEWRARAVRGPFRLVVAGLIVSLLVCAGVAGGFYVADQLRKQKAERQQQFRSGAALLRGFDTPARAGTPDDVTRGLVATGLGHRSGGAA